MKASLRIIMTICLIIISAGFSINTSAQSTGSRLTQEEARILVNLHNVARSEVGVGEIIWANELAAYAQEWIDHLARTDCQLKHRPRSGSWKQKYGENGFAGSAGYYGVADAAKSWKGEKKYYGHQVLNSSNWSSSGHYTQMVWRKSTQIGCGKIECGGQIIIICNYNPPGNIMGEKPY
jgi:pathogenesis-related protein 1